MPLSILALDAWGLGHRKCFLSLKPGNAKIERGTRGPDLSGRPDRIPYLQVIDDDRGMSVETAELRERSQSDKFRYALQTRKATPKVVAFFVPVEFTWKLRVRRE